MNKKKKAAIIKAQGESEAAKLINEAMKQGTGFIDIRRIEAAREIAEALSENRDITYLPTGVSMLLNLPGGSGSRRSGNSNQPSPQAQQQPQSQNH